MPKVDNELLQRMYPERNVVEIIDCIASGGEERTHVVTQFQRL